MIIKEHNVTTGEIIEHEMNEAQIEQMQRDEAEALAKAEAQAIKATQKAALLAKLGITEDEAKLLLG